MDGSLLQVGLVAAIGAMVLTMYEMGAALRPVSCPDCPHCKARAIEEAQQQEVMAREYARRMGLDDEDSDRDRRRHRR